MNRPSELYTFLADKHCDIKYSTLYKFRNYCIEELKENPDGIKFPNFFMKIGRKFCKANNRTVKNKYGKEYLFTNAHSDGWVITSFFSFKTNYNNKNYSLTDSNLYKFTPSKPVKRLQTYISKNNYIDFDIIKTEV